MNIRNKYIQYKKELDNEIKRHIDTLEGLRRLRIQIEEACDHTNIEQYDSEMGICQDCGKILRKGVNV